ncbi:MAG TPA: addiction module protein [Chloroflexota bacterium]|jgi:putative addiction module component (TIGR02574 family)|nr:addiction module protein [Chloroflexota bacterium]
MATNALANIQKLTAQLSIAERIQLAEELWDSVTDDLHEIAVTEAQRVELDRRLAEAEAHPDEGVPWPEVKARLLRHQ